MSRNAKLSRFVRSQRSSLKAIRNAVSDSMTARATMCVQIAKVVSGMFVTLEQDAEAFDKADCQVECTKVVFASNMTLISETERQVFSRAWTVCQKVDRVRQLWAKGQYAALPLHKAEALSHSHNTDSLSRAEQEKRFLAKQQRYVSDLKLWECKLLRRAVSERIHKLSR